jgi:hypothetical protein
MNIRFLILFLSIPFAFTAGSLAQTFSSSSLVAENEGSDAAVTSVGPTRPASAISARPFSQVAVGAGVSPLGIGIDVSTNLNSHLNLRTSGSFFDQPIHFTTNGFHADAQLKLASARTSLDIYPFHLGFRLSPGVMFYNQNRVTATDTIASGTSFTLNGDTFYSANANAATGTTPVNGSALMNLHATRPAFTITGGWGEPLARNGHWSFPVEVGVALVGAPKLNVKLAG